MLCHRLRLWFRTVFASRSPNHVTYCKTSVWQQFENLAHDSDPKAHASARFLPSSTSKVNLPHLWWKHKLKSSSLSDLAPPSGKDWLLFYDNYGAVIGSLPHFKWMTIRGGFRKWGTVLHGSSFHARSNQEVAVWGMESPLNDPWYYKDFPWYFL